MHLLAWRALSRFLPLPPPRFSHHTPSHSPWTSPAGVGRGAVEGEGGAGRAGVPTPRACGVGGGGGDDDAARGRLAPPSLTTAAAAPSAVAPSAYASTGARHRGHVGAARSQATAHGSQNAACVQGSRATRARGAS
jgi:hypothetical protein